MLRSPASLRDNGYLYKLYYDAESGAHSSLRERLLGPTSWRGTEPPPTYISRPLQIVHMSWLRNCMNNILLWLYISDFYLIKLRTMMSDHHEVKGTNGGDPGWREVVGKR